MYGFAKGMGRFNLQPSPKRRKKSQRRGHAFIDIESRTVGVKAWRAVSRAFIRTGEYIQSAATVVVPIKNQPNRTVRIIAADRNITDSLKSISVICMHNGKLRFVAKDRKTAAFLKNTSFEIMPNGEICVAQNKE
jgi:hypothetical protein